MHTGNSTAQHPDSAFSPVQIALARLEALTDVKPAAYYQHADMYEARSTRGRWVGETFLHGFCVEIDVFKRVCVCWSCARCELQDGRFGSTSTLSCVCSIAVFLC
jgi:hypothetical protein